MKQQWFTVNAKQQQLTLWGIWGREISGGRNNKTVPVVKSIDDREVRTGSFVMQNVKLDYMHC
jgi:hypothetical protein